MSPSEGLVVVSIASRPKRYGGGRVWCYTPSFFRAHTVLQLHDGKHRALVP